MIGAGSFTVSVQAWNENVIREEKIDEIVLIETRLGKEHPDSITKDKYVSVAEGESASDSRKDGPYFR